MKEISDIKFTMLDSQMKSLKEETSKKVEVLTQDLNEEKQKNFKLTQKVNDLKQRLKLDEKNAGIYLEQIKEKDLLKEENRRLREREQQLKEA